MDQGNVQPGGSFNAFPPRIVRPKAWTSEKINATPANKVPRRARGGGGESCVDGPGRAENLDSFGASYEDRTSWKYISSGAARRGGPTYGATKERNPCLGLNVPWRPELWVSSSLSGYITLGSIQPQDQLQARACPLSIPCSFSRGPIRQRAISYLRLKPHSLPTTISNGRWEY